MKSTIAIIIGCIAISMSGYALACGGGGGCGDGGGGCGDGGGCGASNDDAYQSRCQCTDPICDRPWYSDCMSRAYCCEAFGNIGGTQ